ncbi:MAG: preprotein translocase subunit YajC [Micropruina sp.]|nr:MAG: preprotein translocase subunit YajC [Micropruina sp.]
MPIDLSSILMFVALGAVFYFMLIRPQQKRAKEQAAMTNSVAPGSRVMITAGIVGTIKHVGERQAIIEISPGVEMTIFKAAIAKVLTASDDEFEYADDDASLVEPAAEPDEVSDEAPTSFAAPAADDAVPPAEPGDQGQPGQDPAKR